MATDMTVPDVHLHIGDERRSTGGAGLHEHVYPVTGEVQSAIPMAGPDDVDQAVGAAERAFTTWRSWSTWRRRDVLLRLADLLEADLDELSRLSVLDNGMTPLLGSSLASGLIDYTRYYAGWADKLEGRVTSLPANGRELGYTMPEPFGVIGVIITWNGPMISLGMKVIPALAAGNTVVIKPSELTPYAMERFMRAVEDAGIPAGVVNVVPGGAAAGEALVRHPAVKKVTFTGGPATARRILAACAEHLKPTVLELGGKSANIVFPDADLDAVSAVNSFTVFEALAGQGCAIPTRILVHDDVYDALAERLAARVGELRAGDPFDPATNVGPVVTKAAQERILAMVGRARQEGSARVLVGGGQPGGELESGFFVEPTLLGDVRPSSEIEQVEVFGPVVSMLRFRDEDEALRIANGTEYGLASYLWTNDVNRITRLTAELDAGGVYVNGAMPVLGCELPFGGTGISGFGRESGEEGIREFLRTKAVAIA